MRMLQMLSAGREKMDEAHKLIRSKKKEHEETLLSLRKWFYNHASQVKDALQNDSHIDETRRQVLEKLVNDYTIIITEIDRVNV